MRSAIAIALIALVPASLAAGGLFEHAKAASCKAVKSSCDNTGYKYCSDLVLHETPQKTTTKVTVSTVTVTADKTASTIITNACPTHGPGEKKKRDEPDVLEARNPEPTPAPLYDSSMSLNKRQNPPNCLARLGVTNSAQISSACSCFDYPVTSSTRTVTRTTTLAGAPTTTKYSRTVTITTLEPSPTCQVVSTNKAGKKTTWKEFYGVCNASRSGLNGPSGDAHVYPANTLRCDALNMCADDTFGEGASTFELEYTVFQSTPGGPVWHCQGYRAGPTPLDYFVSGDGRETYGYYHN